jgi:hypothetical protein
LHILLAYTYVKSAASIPLRDTNDDKSHEGLYSAERRPYSPDLAPCDFALFPKLKIKLKGRRFETVSDIQTESQAVLDSIRENDFHGFFEK